MALSRVRVGIDNPEHAVQLLDALQQNQIDADEHPYAGSWTEATVSKMAEDARDLASMLDDFLVPPGQPPARDLI